MLGESGVVSGRSLARAGYECQLYYAYIPWESVGYITRRHLVHQVRKGLRSSKASFGKVENHPVSRSGCHPSFVRRGVSERTGMPPCSRAGTALPAAAVASLLHGGVRNYWVRGMQQLIQILSLRHLTRRSIEAGAFFFQIPDLKKRGWAFGHEPRRLL